jgi:[ribosomal protein S18]-alanine N-acetyltransferase
MTDPTVRIMQSTDLAAIMAIEITEYPFPWTKSIFLDCLRVGYSCWVLEENNTILGYAVMSIAANECHVLNLCVARAYQRRGLGKYLLQHLLDVAHTTHSTVVYLEVRASNQPALRLYQQQGFNEIGHRYGYYPAAKGREDAIILALTIL